MVAGAAVVSGGTSGHVPARGKGAPAGIRVEAVSDWLERSLTGCRPPLRFELVAGGFSHLTYRVTDAAGHSWVLRRPPLTSRLATAHDIGREFRILSALGQSAVPVPRTLALCEEERVTGAHFFVMEEVPGTVLRGPEEAAAYPAASRRDVSEHLVDLLVALHAVDPDDVGLGELGRREHYIERQLWRWHRQWEQSRMRDNPLVERGHERLSRAVPPQDGTAIVHGDYRLDNTIVGDDGTVRAVLDWELCTLGDALADLGLLLVYWVLPGEDPVGLRPPTTVPGFPARGELLERYARQSARDVSNIGYYVAFGHWKLACINEGVYARFLSGAMGETDVDADAIAEQAGQRAELALELIG